MAGKKRSEREKCREISNAGRDIVKRNKHIKTKPPCPVQLRVIIELLQLWTGLFSVVIV